jgi:Glycosyl hydrolase family 9
VTLKEIGPSLALTLLSIVAFIAGFINFNVNVNAPKAIALCWVVYNVVPHALLLAYSRYGPGIILHGLCNVFCIMQSILSVLALILLWRLYPREADYGRATGLSLAFTYTEWSGATGANFPISWRKSSGTANSLTLNFTHMDPLLETKVAEVEERTVDLSGGFYTEGEVGPVKITTHVAYTTALLAWSLLEFEDWWRERPGDLARGLALVAHGLEYCRAAYVPAGPPIGWPAGVEPPFSSQDTLVYLVRAGCFVILFFGLLLVRAVCVQRGESCRAAARAVRLTRTHLCAASMPAPVHALVRTAARGLCFRGCAALHCP